ncbi:MAG: strictosidine synthase [Rhizobiaceae bacterium]|nr:strictosidine synthase [Rhizobiaceae bacterium]
MIAAARRAWENFRGVGDAAVTVPPLDGALRPNPGLEEARLVASLEAPDCIVVHDGAAYVTSGTELLRLGEGSGTDTVAGFESAVTALAVSPAGHFAVGLENGTVAVTGGRHNGRRIDRLGGAPLMCATALMFEGEDALVVAQGSLHRPPSQWKHDLMERRADGAVWRVHLKDGRADKLAGDLAWPCGLAAANGAIAVSESWKHRIVAIGGGGRPRVVLWDLPGYPARLTQASAGGFWLAVFAPRNQLIEFVQREPVFLGRMMAEVDPDWWAAPSLTPSDTFLVPLQGGAQKHLGMLKPWSPTFSYGLVVRLDGNFRAVSSLHSRADGRRHGVTACAELGEEVLIASRGGGAILAAPVEAAHSVVRAMEAAQ